MEAVSTTFSPWQTVVEPLADMVAPGFALTVTAVPSEVPVHPEALVAVTV